MWVRTHDNVLVNLNDFTYVKISPHESIKDLYVVEAVNLRRVTLVQILWQSNNLAECTNALQFIEFYLSENETNLLDMVLVMSR
jgi:hypothetical protein